MVVVGDIECLKSEADSDIFKRLERTVRRDGEIIELDKKSFRVIHDEVGLSDEITFEEVEGTKKSGITKISVPEIEKIVMDDDLKENIKPEIEKVKTEVNNDIEPENDDDLRQPDLFG